MGGGGSILWFCKLLGSVCTSKWDGVSKGVRGGAGTPRWWQHSRQSKEKKKQTLRRQQHVANHQRLLQVASANKNRMPYRKRQNGRSRMLKSKSPTQSPKQQQTAKMFPRFGRLWTSTRTSKKKRQQTYWKLNGNQHWTLETWKRFVGTRIGKQVQWVAAQEQQAKT